MDGNCQVHPIQEIASDEELQTLETILLAVEGMGCASCGARVRNNLLALHGVVEANIQLASGMGDVTFNPRLAGLLEMIEAVAEAGADGQHTYRAQVVNGPGLDIGYHG